MVTIETDFSDFAIELEMQNGFHPDTPRNPTPRFAQFRILWISFITFLSGNAKRICKTVLVNSVLFFPACYACACKTTELENSSNPF